jgi:tetratricopeptide (TPR) repeat protein
MRIASRFLVFLVGVSCSANALAATDGVGTTADKAKQAEAQLRAARAAVERYHYEEAQRLLAGYLKLRPDDPNALLLAARTARALNGFDKAKEFLDRYQRVRGENDDLKLERMLLRAQRGEVDEVADFCEKLVNDDHPQTPLILEAMAGGCYRAYRLAQADAFLRMWENHEKKAGKKMPQLYFLRARVHELAGHNEDAIEAYQTAVKLDDQRDDARSRLAILLLELSRPREARPHLEQLRRCRPDDLQIQVAQAHGLNLLGKSDEAEKLLKAVLKKEPKYGPALAACGMIAQNKGRMDEAEDLLRRAAKLMPLDYQVQYQFYLSLERKGDKKKEAAAVQARLKMIEEDARRSREIIPKLQTNPRDFKLHHELGMIYLRHGLTEEGVRLLETAVKENPRYGPAHRELAQYYRRAGDARRADRHAELARKADPEP